MTKNDPMKPSVAMLVKLGSIVVHADEMLSPNGHDFDRIALAALLSDPDVVAWLDAMGPMLPLKRTL